MKSAGIYLHIPFCAVKCMYCDFYSITDRENSIPSFIKAIMQEIKECKIDASDWIIDTIFIGGGTTSLLNENMIESILSQIHKKYDLSNIREITIEANPGEAPKGRLKSFYEMGINRISIGAQSFQPNLLQFLTRIHNRDQIFETYDNVRDAGFDNINCDFYGFKNKEPIWGNNFYQALVNSKMGLNLSRGLPTKYYSSNRIASLIGNGLLTFIDKKTQLGDFFNDNEIILYDNINDLSEKIKFYKNNSKIRIKIARNGKKKYFKLFNELKITKYIVDKSLGSTSKLF